MKQTVLYLAILYLNSSICLAQRPATAAETAEDARVLKILSAAMPHEIEGAPDPAERSFGSSNITGISGFYNDMNFATRDVFDHQYTISYQFTQAPPELKDKIEAAKAKNDIEYIYALSHCDVEVYVNSSFTIPYFLSPVKKASTSYSSTVYTGSDLLDNEKNVKGNFVFFGNNWIVKPDALDAEDVFGKPQKRYSLTAKLNTHPGTDIQGIVVFIKGHPDVTDLIVKKINWQKISGLLGTGKITDDESASELKKYYAEKPVNPVPGNNTLSFIYIDENGKEKTYAITSSKHDLSNCALLRNHNENPKVLQEAHIDFRIQDDKDQNKLFTISLPIIRTTGTVTATYESDYDYQIMWRGNTDANHSFTASAIEISLIKWAPVGEFLEGSFSGTATINDHNDFSTKKPSFTIKNGKFRIRRIADEMH